MKVKDAIKYLNEYEDKEQEIMIAWNDDEVYKENFEELTDEAWVKAVGYFNSTDGFNQDCDWAVTYAISQLKTGEIK